MDERVPAYLQAALVRQYGEAPAAEILAGCAEKRRVSLRLNPLRADPEATDAALRAAGLDPQPLPWYADARLLPEAPEAAAEALPEYARGDFYLQGLSAMLPALLLGAAAGESVLDMCAAPGGKSAQLAALSGGKAGLTCCERDPLRTQRLRFNLERQGVKQVTVMNTDARRLDDFFRFDRILLDAPCTGSGTLDLTPGAPPRRMEPAWVKKTVQTQKALLKKAMTLLKPSGRLVYSTCSVLAEENEDVARTALADSRFRLIPAPEDLAAQLPLLPVTLPGTLCVKPTRDYEGFFVAVLEKR